MPEPIDPTPDAEAGLIEAEQGDAVAAAIEALPERQREAILLVHYQDLSGAEAASVLDISIEALESLLARGATHVALQAGRIAGGDGCLNH